MSILQLYYDCEVVVIEEVIEEVKAAAFLHTAAEIMYSLIDPDHPVLAIYP